MNSLESDKPTEINADTTEWNRNTNQVVARGNASIKQGESIVKAPEITGYFTETDGHRVLDRVVAVGGVNLLHEDRVLVSDSAIAYFGMQEGKRVLTKAEADKNVKITSATQTAMGDKSLYDPKEDSAILEGNVILIQDQNQLRGDWAKTNFTTGQHELKSTKTENGQVQGLFFPKKANQK